MSIRGEGVVAQQRSQSQAKDLLTRIIDAVGGLGFRLASKDVAKIASEAEQELANAPRIALLGQTGVGKSATINALFNAGAPIDHVKPCTPGTLDYAVVSDVEGKNGVLRIYDMAGIGQDTKSDPKCLAEYRRILPECEVALWVIDATTRHLSEIEVALRDVVAPAMGGLDRVVLGLNKVEHIEPAEWNVRTNLPSVEQEQNISARIEDVRARLGAALDWQVPRIVAYSAKRRYRLEKLMREVVSAFPADRRWVLQDRAAVARFQDLVDPIVLKAMEAKGGARP